MEQRRECTHNLPDWSYGEPLVPQHVVIDFTPSKETDTDFIHKKCCEFWDFVKNSPELTALMVLPELVQFNGSEKDGSLPPESDSYKSQVASEKITDEKTAISVLELAMGKGVTKMIPSQMYASGAVLNTFMNRLPNTCMLDDVEYLEDDNNDRGKWPVIGDEISTSAVRNKGSFKTSKGMEKDKSRSTADVKHLCATMRNWDCNHPKSMKPPGPVPLLSHSVMQRKSNN